MVLNAPFKSTVLSLFLFFIKNQQIISHLPIQEQILFSFSMVMLTVLNGIKLCPSLIIFQVYSVGKLPTGCIHLLSDFY